MYMLLLKKESVQNIQTNYTKILQFLLTRYWLKKKKKKVALFGGKCAIKWAVSEFQMGIWL